MFCSPIKICLLFYFFTVNTLQLSRKNFDTHKFRNIMTCLFTYHIFLLIFTSARIEFVCPFNCIEAVTKNAYLRINI